MTPAEKTRTVYLRKGMKFSAIIGKAKGKNGKFQRKKFVGPCAVEMTDAQIESFKDLLQTAPQELVTEVVDEDTEDTNGNGAGEFTGPAVSDPDDEHPSGE